MAYAISEQIKQKVISNASLGAFYKILSCLCFALINVSIRFLNGGSGHLSQPMSSYQITFLQYFVGLIIFLPWVSKNKEHLKITASLAPMHIIRVLFAVLGLLFWYLSLKYMPLMQALALGVLNPIFTVIGAKFYLKEEISPLRYVSIFLALLGGMIVLRPDRAFEFQVAMLLPLLSSLFFACNKLLTRKLAKIGENPIKLTCFLLLSIAPIAFIPAAFNWTFGELWQWGHVAVLGALAGLAQYFIALSLKYANVSFLNPFGFARIFFSAFLGYLFFAEVPTDSSWWLGAVLILLSLFALYKSKADISL